MVGLFYLFKVCWTSSFESKYKILKSFYVALIASASLLKSMAQLQEISSDFEYLTSPSIGQHQLDSYDIYASAQMYLGRMPLTLSANYSRKRMTYFDVQEIQNIENFETPQMFQTEVGLCRPITEKLSINASLAPMLASNFEQGLSSEDLIWNYGLYLNFKWGQNNHKSNLKLGVARGTVLGEPSFYPTVSYSTSYNDLWGFTIGFPQASIFYSVSERHRVAIYLDNNGFYSNNSDSSTLSGPLSTINSKLVFSTTDFSIEHQFQLQPRLMAFSKIGLSKVHDLHVEDTVGSMLYDFNPNESIFFTMGLKYNLKLNSND